MEYSKLKRVKALPMVLMGYEHEPETIRPTSRSLCRQPRKDERLQRLKCHVWQRRFINEEKTDRSKWDVNKTRPGEERRQEQKTTSKTIPLTGARRIPAPQIGGGHRRTSTRCLCMRKKSIPPSSFHRWRAARWARRCDQCLRSRPTLHNVPQRFYTLAHTNTPLN